MSPNASDGIDARPSCYWGPCGTTVTHPSSGRSSGSSVHRVVNRIALGRMSEADEVAGAALYPASDESSFVTAQTLVVDGGISVCMPQWKEATP